jgi:hypothetical protein
MDRTVRAPACERITRTKFHMREEGILSRIDKTAMAELNCSVSGSSLPRDIFLDKSGWYNFTMELFLATQVSGIASSSLYNVMLFLYTSDFDAITLAVKLSTPDALSIQVRRSYQSVTNSLMFKVG